jgi:PAS domain-containing protein
MLDTILETLRTIVLLGIVGFLLRADRKRFEQNRMGWTLIIVGFSLLTFGSFMDITDGFESLNQYVVIGHTDTEAVLEEVVGFLGGFIFLAMGLYFWLPSVESLSDEIAARKRTAEILVQAEEDLRRSEARFRDFAESSTDWLWEMDEELRFTYL